MPPLPTAKLRLMRSYGGQIVPRPNTNSLCYVSGETRIVSVDRRSVCFGGFPNFRGAKVGKGRRMPNWELKNCCDRDQKAFIITIGIYTVAILALWRTFLLTPFKLITVFLHEASHAIACMLTCGKVEGIQVHANEGGVTQTRGGIYWLILPAGYLGSSFWGMVLILASTNLLTARIAAGCFGAALLVVLFVAKNVRVDTSRTLHWSVNSRYYDIVGSACFCTWPTVALVLYIIDTLQNELPGFIIFLAVIWVLQETTKLRILRYVILFIGVMNSLFSVYGTVHPRLSTTEVDSKWLLKCQVRMQGNDIFYISWWSNVPRTCHLVLRYYLLMFQVTTIIEIKSSFLLISAWMGHIQVLNWFLALKY
ncbi:hypothetical protein RJ640_011021 [Escallonia rubra]|uniref:Uncharacterized protein n=1 Tax=Escallonia rubra TaxID=112253 RepID=A0AA88RPL5_9ASTE|nr:hypothetical protein RJ640_011021 [Escallonia rubra]